MVRISTQYDNTIVNDKEVGKVFMIRGDEGYARTTDVVFGIITDDSSADSVQGYKVAFYYDVLRDVGSSTVILYDNDVVIKEFDWSSDNGMQYIGTTNDHTVIDPNTCLYLPYDEEHKLWMKYNGNTHSLYSKSKQSSVYCDLPLEFYTNIAFSDVELLGDDMSFNLTLTIHGQVTSATYGKGIEIYLDDEYIETVSTPDDSNVVECELSGIEDGHHMITAIVVGDEEIYTATNNYEFDSGYDISIVSYPQPFINNLGGDIVVRALYNGEPFEDATVDFISGSATTDEDGYATISLTTIGGSGEYYATCYDKQSEPVTITVANPSLSIDTDRTYLVPDTVTWVRFNIGEEIERVPVAYERICPKSQVSSLGYTTNDGIVQTLEDWSKGKGGLNTDGKITYNAWIDGLKSSTLVSKTIYDPILYWNNESNGNDGKFSDNAYPFLNEQGFYIRCNSAKSVPWMGFSKDNDDFQIDFSLKMIRCTKLSMKIHNGDTSSAKFVLVDTNSSDKKNGKFSVIKKGNTVTLIQGNKTFSKTFDTTAKNLYFYFDTYSKGNLIKIYSINYYKV